MKLLIETKDQDQAKLINAAYENAMNTTNLVDFVESLKQQLPAYKIGRGGSHVWISQYNNVRSAIVETGIFTR